MPELCIKGKFLRLSLKWRGEAWGVRRVRRDVKQSIPCPRVPITFTAAVVEK
jgi:hypothetical protein